MAATTIAQKHCNLLHIGIYNKRSKYQHDKLFGRWVHW